MKVVRLPEQLGYRARKTHRAMLRLGRARGMTLVADQFGKGELTVDNWAPAFRERFGGHLLNDDDLALSLSGHPLHEPPGPDWPTFDLIRAYEHVASLASPDPDDVQLAAELIERPDLPAEVAEVAQALLTDYRERTLAARTRWQIDEERFEFLRQAERAD